MSDLVTDTEVHRAPDGQWTGRLMPNWEVWGPYGGYVGAMLLRAARLAGGLARPASMSLSFLRPPAFGDVAIAVDALHNGRAAVAQTAMLRQEERNRVAASIWSVTESTGLQHDDARMPRVPAPETLQRVDYFEHYLPSESTIWSNFECRPVFAEVAWPPQGPVSPEWRAWVRLRQPIAAADPWLHACRSMVALDLVGWSAAVRAHAWQNVRPLTPSLDIYAAFHDEEASDEWLLCDGWSPIAAHGLVHWRGSVWSQRGRLLASGGGQCLHRP